MNVYIYRLKFGYLSYFDFSISCFSPKPSVCLFTDNDVKFALPFSRDSANALIDLLGSFGYDISQFEIWDVDYVKFNL